MNPGKKNKASHYQQRICKNKPFLTTNFMSNSNMTTINPLLLPPGWTLHLSKKRKLVYFYKHATKDSFWSINDVLKSEAKSKSTKTISCKRKNVFDSSSSTKRLCMEPNEKMTQSTSSKMTSISQETFEMSKDLERFADINHNQEPTNNSELDVQILYIVIDTNILLHNFEILEEKSLVLSSDKCKIILMIPWIVLRELVHLKLKKNKDLARRVDAAIRFLHSQLSDPNSSIQRGESMTEKAQIYGDVISTNDDIILLECLELKERTNSSAVLLTCDRNLRIKTHVNGCSAFTPDNIRERLPELVENLEIKSKHVRIYNSLKVTMLRALSMVLSRVMCVVHEEKWREMVKIKSPWTLVDVFATIDERWLSEFGFIFSDDHKKIFKLLSDFFIDNRGRDETPRIIRMAVQRSLLLCRHVNENQDDFKLLKQKPSDKIEVSKEIDELLSLSEEFDKEMLQIEDFDVVKVIFSDVINKISSVCASVAQFLCVTYEYKHSVRVMSEKEVLDAVTRFNENVQILIREFKLLVNDNPNKSKENNIAVLFATLNKFYSDDENLMNKITYEIFYKFCVFEANIEYLKDGMFEVFKLSRFLRELKGRQAWHSSILHPTF
uniref:WW domain-containing protein n=1 Tax=Strigamia maritima TaxID=126957 RepID=T1IL95_STRMM